jgi:hypothetical protein
MARSECFCDKHSCESTLSQNTRFQFDKEGGINGYIVDGRVVDNSIANCELKTRVSHKDSDGYHEVKNNYSDRGGHKERSLANDHRRKGHKEHWRKEKNKLKYNR